MRARWGMWLLPGLLWSACAFAQRPEASIPDSRNAVVEVLPKGYAALMPRRNRLSTVEEAQILLDTAARSGDARLIARADALLASYAGPRATPATLRARAHVAQYRHDFATALELLDRALKIDPRDGAARHARAQILLVQGEIGRARGECASLAVGIDADRGLLCLAAVETRRGEYDQAIGLLDGWLARAGDGDGDGDGDGGDRELHRHVLVMRAEAASRRGDADADAWFRRALALDPADVRTLAAMSLHLRARGRPAEAYALLAAAPRSDHLVLERALAAHESGQPDAPALAAEIARRFELARRLGSEPDVRDEAEYHLTLRDEPKRALELAQHNFEEQRDYEDVDLLARAIVAADRPDAWKPVQGWAERQQLPLTVEPGR
jgi:tetratricopeptide (TPR) repeat protein